MNPPIHALIFDMVGVLFGVDKRLGLKHVGFGPLLAYCLRNKSNPFDQGMKILDKMRCEVPGEFQDRLTYKGTLMPLSITLWQRGQLTSKEAMTKILLYFEELDKKNYFLHKEDKEIIDKIIQLMLEPQFAHSILKPIASSINLIKELKGNHPLYLLSNINHEIMDELAKKFHDFFSLFDGVITSCSIQLLKPDPEIFTHVLTSHNLVAESTCFIDDQIENILTAQKLGMQTIHCTQPHHLKKILRKLGVTINK
jgi:HAD superfamily hydrolase (TIGR01509 family)